jgi:RNA polymerase sigma factor (sigma-70 family)
MTMINWDEYRPNALRALRLDRFAALTYDEKEEIVQETMLYLIEKGLPSVDTATASPALIGWLVGKRAIWMGLDYIRKNYRRMELDMELVDQDQETTFDEAGEPIGLARGLDPEQATIINDCVTKALAALTPEQRQSVYLVDVLGHTYQEGADLTGISKQSFYRRHQRATKAIARWRTSSGC